ncbi:MAG: flavodoxin domain-containing protein, partial [Planctomycetota bacterium]
MRVLNIYSSNTGNTEKVAKKISEAVEMLNFEVDTIKIREDIPDINLL